MFHYGGILGFISLERYNAVLLFVSKSTLESILEFIVSQVVLMCITKLWIQWKEQFSHCITWVTIQCGPQLLKLQWWNRNWCTTQSKASVPKNKFHRLCISSSDLPWKHTLDTLEAFYLESYSMAKYEMERGRKCLQYKNMFLFLSCRFYMKNHDLLAVSQHSKHWEYSFKFCLRTKRESGSA